MTNEQVKSLTETALNTLMDDLAKGHSDALKRYLAVMSRFHKYSWGNSLLISFQCPEATHVAGFRAWLKLGRHVRKGEKGIAIIAPMVGRKHADMALTEDEQTRLFGFRIAHVFDIAQTDGETLAEFATVKGDPHEYTERARRALLVRSALMPALLSNGSWQRRVKMLRCDSIRTQCALACG